MKDFLELLDKKTAFTASAVCGTFVILVLILGVIGKTTYSPYIIETYFGISDDLEKRFKSLSNDIVEQLSDRENPVGYSKTFTYDNASAVQPVQQTLIVYARESQYMKIDITSNAYLEDRRASANADPGNFQLSIDNEPWPNTGRRIGDSEEVLIDGKDLPKVTNGVGTGTHTIVVSTLPHRYAEISSFDCLVLVQNRPF